MSAVITFKCPECGQPIEGPYEKTICPICSHEFIPAIEPRIINEDLARLEKKIAQDKRDEARKRAPDFRSGAILLLVIAALTFLGGVGLAIMASSGDTDILPSAGAFAICGICLKASAIFYIIYLLIHIRANTEK